MPTSPRALVPLLVLFMACSSAPTPTTTPSTDGNAVVDLMESLRPLPQATPPDDLGSVLGTTSDGAAPDGQPVRPQPTGTPPPMATSPLGVAFVEVSTSAGVGLLHTSPLGEKDDGRRFMGGAAAGDLDRDGDIDLFVLGGGNTADALFRNNGDGTYTDVGELAGVAEPHIGAGVTMADYDGDGLLDVYVTSHGVADAREPGQHRLFRNDGDLTFTDVADEAGVAFTSADRADGFGAAFGDMDLDGDLDLFVAGWRRESDGNRLFRNDGDGTFTDVTVDAGIFNEGVRGFGGCWTDLNADRLPDLLVIADFGTTDVYTNDGDGTFTEIIDTFDIDLTNSQAMGTTVADINGDGLLDWYVTAIFDDENSGRGAGNQLFLAQPDGGFADASAALGVDDGGWGWGTAAADLNHDGWLDLVATNGWSLPAYEDEGAKLFLSDEGESFTQVAEQVGLDHRVNGLSVIRYDHDGDGDEDIAISAADNRFSLFRNDLPADSGGWLRVNLDTSGSQGLAPDGFGSRVTVVTGDQRQVREINGCANYLSSNPATAHFGIGDAGVIDEVLVDWPNGTQTTLASVEPGQQITITP